MTDHRDPPFAIPPPVGGGSVDAHGQAALLLVESLIHGLIARSALTSAEAVEIIDMAADIKVEMAEEMNERRAVLADSIALLTALSNSLRHDLR